MITQGTDGVSRGSFKEGVDAGEDMIKLRPWGKFATEADSKLK